MNFRYLSPLKKGNDSSSLTRIRNEMDELFNRFFSDFDTFPLLPVMNSFPAMNVSETEKHIVIKAELSGLEEKEIEIQVDKDRLTLRGEKKVEIEEDDKKSTCYVREISCGKFSRTLKMPFEIDPEKTKAVFSKGMLTITVDKPKERISQARSIQIMPE